MGGEIQGVAGCLDKRAPSHLARVTTYQARARERERTRERIQYILSGTCRFTFK